MNNCRCGYNTSNDYHPCHGNGYTCKKPAKPRFYNPKLVALAGVQTKFQVSETYACDDCWENFSKVVKQMEETQNK